jgi:dUTP pyrophosphatase
MRKVKVKVCNKSNNALPEYKTELSAGFDTRIQLDKEGKYRGNGHWIISAIDNHISLSPGGRIVMPTGLFVAIPDGYELQIRPRSGLAADWGITILNTPGTIDGDFRGEIGLIIINTDLYTSFEINQGDRLAQGVIKQVEQGEWEEVDTIEELGITERGSGGLGSTGKN